MDWSQPGVREHLTSPQRASPPRTKQPWTGRLQPAPTRITRISSSRVNEPRPAPTRARLPRTRQPQPVPTRTRPPRRRQPQPAPTRTRLLLLARMRAKKLSPRKRVRPLSLVSRPPLTHGPLPTRPPPRTPSLLLGKRVRLALRQYHVRRARHVRRLLLTPSPHPVLRKKRPKPKSALVNDQVAGSLASVVSN